MERRDPPAPAPLVVLVRDGVEVGTWPVDLALDEHLDLGVVDRVARVQLCACRVGAVVRLRNAPPPLVGLLRLVGLGELVEMGGEPEDREEPHVHEAVVPSDPAV